MWEKIKFYLACFVGLAALFVVISIWRIERRFFRKKKPLKVGTKAPDFTLPDENNNERTLKEFAGQYVVLYFYPKDYTPMCTEQACNIQKSFERFKKNGIVVLGINYDSPEDHKGFREKYHLEYSLLSDEKKEVAAAYKAESGIEFVPKRITFVINKKGFICGVIPYPNIKTHVDEVLEIIEKDRAKRR